MNSEEVISHTTQWIEKIVIGCNFCPFAAKVLKQDSIQFEVLKDAGPKSALNALSVLFSNMEDDAFIETSLLIMPGVFPEFAAYLQVLKQAESLLYRKKFDGIFQLASFHPLYVFAGSEETDPANYTNRSPYPMIHILREDSVTAALESYPKANEIPDNNIHTARKIGLAQMVRLRDACFK
ncbi:MAG: DUF1415 domain-containing protein [Ferruginibacter sp.]